MSFFHVVLITKCSCVFVSKYLSLQFWLCPAYFKDKKLPNNPNRRVRRRNSAKRGQNGEIVQSVTQTKEFITPPTEYYLCRFTVTVDIGGGLFGEPSVPLANSSRIHDILYAVVS